MSTVKITIGKIVIGVELLDTPTAQAIAANLPIGSQAKHGKMKFILIPQSQLSWKMTPKILCKQVKLVTGLRDNA